jgi:AcrR family transcriptional regulator
VEAVLDVFAAGGYDGLTIEAVAERAGVARSTVYRRYPAKDELLAGALEHLASVEPLDPDTGSVEGDLLEIARGLRRLLRGRIGRTVPAALTAAARQPVVARDHRRLVALRRQPALAAVRRGVERGELDVDTDPDLLVDLVSGPVFYRHFLSGGPLDDAVLRELVRCAVGTFRPSV